MTSEQNVTIIVPTYNEAENIPELVKRLRPFINPSNILVIDDSPNMKTAAIASRLGCGVIHRQDESPYISIYPNITINSTPLLNQRNNKRSLSSAVILGIACAITDKVIVMDADLQHPPEVIPKLLKALGNNDFAIGSRYTKGGECKEWDFDRKVISRIANLAAMPLVMFKVKDLVSGLFGLKTRGLPNLSKVSTRGFKIMLELLVKGNWDKVTEVPYTFEPRTRGESKLSRQKITDYLMQLAQLYLYKWRWLRFGIIGLSGTLIYFPMLYSLTEFVGLPYLASAAVGIVCASTSNYFLNHYWTFSGQRQASHNHALGWGKYQMMSAISDGAYLGLFALLTELSGAWYMLTALIAMVIIFVVKYIIARYWIWSRPKLSMAG